MSPEGTVYRCRWRKAGGQYSIWIEDHPRLRVSAIDFSLAQQELGSLVLSRFGDGEAVLEYPQGLPMELTLKEFSNPSLVMISGNDRATLKGSWNSLYTGGVCSSCRNPLGPRTDVPLNITDVPRGDGFFLWNGGAIIQCYSESFVFAVLALPEVKVEFRECISNTKRRLFELVGNPVARVVAVKSFGISDRSQDNSSYLTGYRCLECKSLSFLYKIPKCPVYDFIAQSDIKAPPSVFAIESSLSYDLCLSTKCWNLLSERKFRQIISVPLGVAPDHEVVREPNLPER